ncbi:MAG: Ig-like domain-containing protein [Neomegalonema sp.]|nr:Ig-like domain-containing protein [Neomegalonema sp.]
MTTAVVIVSGQSLASHWFSENDSGVNGQLAAEKFQETFLANNSQYDDVIVISAAYGGRPMLQASGSDSFYDETTGGDGPLMADVKSDIDGTSKATYSDGSNVDDLANLTDLELVGVIWAQGEADSTVLGTDDSFDQDYKDGLEYVLNEIIDYALDTYSDQFNDQSEATAYIQHIGRRRGYGTEQGPGLDKVKTIQSEVAAENSNIVIATESYDLELDPRDNDSVHPAPESYHTLAERMALFITTGESGPVVEDVTLTSTTVTFDLAFSDGLDASDLVIGADAKDLLFVVDEGDLSEIDNQEGERYIPVTDISVNGDLVTFTLSRELEGDGYLTYGYGGSVSEEALTTLGDQDTDVEGIRVETGDADQPLQAFRFDFTVDDYSGSDTVAPELSSSTPADDATGVAISQTITLEFNEAIQAGTGSIDLYDGMTLVESFDIASLTIAGTTIEIQPSDVLDYETTYHIEIDTGAIEDLAGNDFAGISDSTTLNFTTEDAPVGLPAGAIAFIGYNADDTTGNPVGGASDSFGFVAIVDLPAGTEISFTDEGWTGTALASGGEDTIVWTSPGVSAGEVVTFERVGSVQVASTGTISAPTGGLLLSGSGDQILAFVGDAAAPSFIAGIQMNGDWDTSYTGTATSLQPAELTGNGTSLAIDPEVDNAYYSGPTSFANTSAALAAINDPANWTTNDVGPLPISGWVDAVDLTGGTPDTTAPSLVSLTPADNTVGVALDSDFTITFDEEVAAGSGGNIVLHRVSDNSVIESFDPNGSQVSFNGTDVTIDPTSDLDASTAYYITVESGAVEDLAGNVFTGWASTATYNVFTTGGGNDTEAPTLVSTSPADDAMNVLVDSNIELVFSEDITAGGGFVNLRESGTNTLIERIYIASQQATITGDTLVIDPTDDLQDGTAYYVQVSSNAVTDLAGNYFEGFTYSKALNFQTAPQGGPDIEAPTLVSSDPLDDATGFDGAADLSFVFSEDVVAGDGYINIRSAVDGSLVERIFADSDQATINGNTLTIDPTSDLAEGTNYYLQLSNDLVEDAAGNSFTGFTRASDLNFQTASSGPIDSEAPNLVSTSPVDDAMDVAVDDVFIFNFDEDVEAGNGYVQLRDATDNSIIERIFMDDDSIIFDGSTLTVDPDAVLETGHEYYWQVSAGAVVDAAGNAFEGFTRASIFDFTTEI